MDGETGLLCNEGDRPALAEHIGRLLADEDLRVRLGRQARRHIAAHFDVGIQADILEDLYDSVIDRTMPRG